MNLRLCAPRVVAVGHVVLLLLQQLRLHSGFLRGLPALPQRALLRALDVGLGLLAHVVEVLSVRVLSRPHLPPVLVSRLTEIEKERGREREEARPTKEMDGLIINQRINHHRNK